MPRMIRIAAFGGFLLAAAGIGPAQTGDSGKQLRGSTACVEASGALQEMR